MKNLFRLMVCVLAIIVYLKQPVAGCKFKITENIIGIPYTILVAGTYNIYGVIGYDKNGFEWVIPWQNIRGFKNTEKE